MLVLGIETSCDETSAAVVDCGKRILSNVIASQIKIHGRYFGVVPELASRAHIENVNWVIEKALKQAGIGTDLGKISVVAYTRGPGLAGSLLVGQLAAQTFSYLLGKPLVGVNHLEGHLYAVLLEHDGIEPPYLGLIVSGGHTELVIVENFGKYKYLGGTRDDAAGEVFDKVSKLLNLGYPGGPIIDKLAKKGNKVAIKFPRPYMRGTWDFSFSGLKTAVINYVKNAYVENVKLKINDICASFQQAVIDTLLEKTFSASKKYSLKKIVLGGGVIANSALRTQFLKKAGIEKTKAFLPSPQLCTDNAAMIACAGYYKMKIKGFSKKENIQKIDPNLKLINW